MKKCPNCLGRGKLEGDTVRLTSFSYRIISWRTCPQCRGAGRVVPKKKTGV
jgi:DnaJ-class molecular chaperone